MLEIVALWFLLGATNDNNVEWDGLYHQPNMTFVLNNGTEYYYRDRNLTSQNSDDPSVDDDDSSEFFVRTFKGDITAAYIRTSADDWATDHSMSWFGNDPSGVYDYWKGDLGSLLTDLEPGTYVYYHFKIVDGTDTENYLKADGIYEDPLYGTDFYFVIEGVKATPRTALANGDDKIYISAYVTDENGHPVSGETVNFSIISGTATLNSTAAITNDVGMAQVYITSTTVGTVTVSASSTNLNDASTTTVTVEFLSFVIDGDSSDWDAMLGSDGNATRNAMSDNSYTVIKGQGIWKDASADHRSDAGTGGDDDLHWFRITGDNSYLYFLAQMGGGGGKDNPMLYVAFDTDPFFNSTADPPDGKPGSGSWQPVPDKGEWAFGCTWDDWLETGLANKNSTPVERWQKDYEWTIDGSDLDGGSTQADNNTDYWADYYYDSARNGPEKLAWDFSPVTHELYLGIEGYNSGTADYFVFLANILTSLTRPAPWGKTGTVMDYQYKMVREGNNTWNSWQYANDTNLDIADSDGDGNTFTSAEGNLPVEGKIDLDDAYPDLFLNGTPTKIYLETASYDTNPGGAVWDPVPVVNSDGDWNSLLAEDFMKVGLKRWGSDYDAVSEWERFFVACTGKTRLYFPNQQRKDYGSGYNYIWLDSNYYNNIAIETKLPWEDFDINPDTDFPKRIRITVAIAQQENGHPKEIYGSDVIDVITNATSTWDEVGSDYTIADPNGNDPTFYGDIDYYLDIDFNRGGKVNVPPGAPIIQSPTSGILVNSEPTLVWSFNDTDGDVAVSPKVWLQIYKDTDADGVFEPGGDDTLDVDVLLDGFITSYSGYTLDSDYTYFWRVKTRDDFSWSPWSEVRSFKLDKNPPTTPVLSSPSNGDVLGYGNVTLSWSASSDGFSGVAGYEIEVSNTTSFDASGTYSLSVPATTGYTFNTNPFPMGVYYWRVRAYDNAGNYGSWSSSRVFKVDYLPPVADFVLVDDFSSPPSHENTDDTYGSIVLDIEGTATASYNKTVNWYEGVLKFSWSGVDNSGNKAYWYATLEDDGDTTPGNDPDYCDCGNMSAIIFYGRSLTGSDVSVLLRVEDAQGNAQNRLVTFSPQWKAFKFYFTWDFWDLNTTSLKSVGFLMDPASDSGVSAEGSVLIGDIYIVKAPLRLYPSHQDVVYDPTPTLRWLPATDLGPSGAVLYDVYISNGTSMNWSSPLETAYNLNTNSYTMSTDLAEGWYSWEMSYHDSVRDENGNWISNWIGCEDTYNFYAMPGYTRNITSVEFYADSSFTTPIDKADPGGKVYVKVVAEDSDPGIKEKAYITVFSDADPVGLKIECNETASGSGVFLGSFIVSSYTDRSNGRLRVAKGGWIKAMAGGNMWTQDAVNDVGGDDWNYHYYARYVDLTGDVFNGGGARYDIRYIDVSSNETHVFFRITVGDNISEDSYHQFYIFIDSDEDESTGTNTDPFSGSLLFRKYSGFDYKVFYEVYGTKMETYDDNNYVQKWDGSSWVNTGAKTVHGEVQAGDADAGSNNTVEFAVAKSDIEVSGSFRFLVYYFNSANWNYGDVYPDETIRFATPVEYRVIDSARDTLRVMGGHSLGSITYYSNPDCTVPASSFDIGSTVYFLLQANSVDDTAVENITAAITTTSSGVSDTLYVNATETSPSSGIFKGNFTLWSSTIPSENKVRASAGDEFLAYPVDQVNLNNLGGSDTADTMDAYSVFVDERSADYSGSFNTHTVPWSLDLYSVYLSRNETHLFVKISSENPYTDGFYKYFLIYLDVDDNETNGGRPDWDWGNVYRPAYDYKIAVSCDGYGNAGGDNRIIPWTGSWDWDNDQGDVELSTVQNGDSFLIGIPLNEIGSPYTKPVRCVVILNNSAGSGEVDYAPSRVSSPPDFWYLGPDATGYVRGPKLLITEVAFDETSGDWVEIYVSSVEHDAQCNLGGYLITDLDGTDTPLPYNITLSAGEYLLVHYSAGGVNETDSVGDVNGNGIREIYLSDPGFTATDDEAVIKSPLGVVLDAVAWSNANGAFTSGEDTDVQTLVDAGQWSDGGDGLQESDTWQDSDDISSGESLARKFYSNGTYVDTDSRDDWIEETLLTVPTPGVSNWRIVGGNIRLNFNSDYVYPAGVSCVLDFNITDPWDETTSDNITGIILYNNGTLPPSNFTDVSVFIDSGDSGPDGFFSPYGWDIAGKGADEVYASPATFNSTSGKWEAFASATIPAGGSLRFFVASKIWVYSNTTQTVQMAVSSNGTYASVVASDGAALNSAGSFPDKANQSVQNIKALYITINEVLINAPGTTSEKNYEYFELFNFGHGSSSLDADPVGEGWKVATQGGMDEFYYHDQENQTVIEVGHYAVYTSNSTLIYDTLQCDWNPNPDALWFTSDDSYIGSYGLTNSGGGLYVLHGKSIVSYFNWDGSDVPSENMTLEKKDPYLENDVSNFQRSSVAGGTPGYYNGFRLREISFESQPGGYIYENQTDVLLLSFVVPDNLGNPDTLNAITVENKPVDGYSAASSSDFTLKLWSDDGDGIFNSTQDTLIGSFTDAGGGLCTLTGLSVNIPAGGLRLFVTADISSSPDDGVTIRPVIGPLDYPAPFESGFTLGIRTSSGNDGPVDLPLNYSRYRLYAETLSDGMKLNVDNPPDPDGGWIGTWNSNYSIATQEDTADYVEGSASLNITITGAGSGGAGIWWQFGYNSTTTPDNPKVPRNMTVYEGGWLRFFFKSVEGDNNITLKIEWNDTATGTTVSSERSLSDFYSPFDGAWHRIDIPLSEFSGVNFTTVVVPVGFDVSDSGSHSFKIDYLLWETPFWIIDSSVPDAPSNIYAYAHSVKVGDSQDFVELNWTASPSADVVGYIVYRSSSGTGPWTQMTPIIYETSFNDTTVIPGNSYYYRVVAVDDACRSSSPTISITAPLMKIAKEASPSVVLPFDNLTYTIYFTNWGYGPAENVIIVENINQSYVKLVSAEAPSGYTVSIEYCVGGTWQSTYDPSATAVRWVFSSVVPPANSEPQASLSYTVQVR